MGKQNAAGSRQQGPATQVAIFAALLLVAFVWSPVRTVEAHANLDRAEPAAESKLAQSPPGLALYFTQGLKPDGSWVQVRDASDKVLADRVEFDPENVKVMRIAVPRLEPGVYTVKWQTLSADDDDYHQDFYKLTVLRPDGSDPAAPSQPNVSRRDDSDGGNSATVYIAGAIGVLVAAGGGFWLLGRRAR